jgi:DNA polymerase III delta subunit
VDLIVFGDVDTDAFTLLEKLFADPKWALTIIDTIKNDGEDRNKFAGMLYRSLKISIFIVDLYTNGTRDSKEIAAYIGWNPWQISKSLKQIDQLQKYAPRIHDFYRGLIDIDYGIKQWRYPDTYFWLGVKKLITNN